MDYVRGFLLQYLMGQFDSLTSIGEHSTIEGNEARIHHIRHCRQQSLDISELETE